MLRLYDSRYFQIVQVLCGRQNGWRRVDTGLHRYDGFAIDVAVASTPSPHSWGKYKTGDTPVRPRQEPISCTSSGDHKDRPYKILSSLRGEEKRLALSEVEWVRVRIPVILCPDCKSHFLLT